MPAMHDLVYSAMEKELSKKLDLFLRTIPFSMTHEECIRLVCDPKHVEVLTEAAVFADVNSSENWMHLDVPAFIDGHTNVEVLLYMRTHAQKIPPLRPRLPLWQIPQNKAQAAAGDKVIAWITKRYEIGRRFGSARRVLHVLNQACESGQQLRYMFPAVMHLCRPGVEPKMDKWMEKFAAYRPCRHVPAVSPHLKQAIQDASALLTSAVLLGEDVPKMDHEFVTICEALLPPFSMDGLQVARM